MRNRERTAVAGFTGMMRELLDAGYGLNEAIGLIARNDISPLVAAIASQVAGEIRGGRGFTAALGTVRKAGGKAFFPDHYLALLSGAEKTGNLAAAFRAQDERLTEAREIRENFHAVLAYPVAVVFLSLAGTPALLWKALPLMGAGNASDPSLLATAVSGCVAAFAALLALAAAFSLVAYRLVGRVSDETLVFSRLAEFARAGLPVTEAIGPCLPFVGSRRFAAALIRLRRDLAGGKPLPRAFRDTGLFSAFVTDTMLVCGSTGSLVAVFERVRAHYAARDKRRRALVTRASEPVIIGITGVYLALTLEATVIPILTGMGGMF